MHDAGGLESTKCVAKLPNLKTLNFSLSHNEIQNNVAKEIAGIII